MILVERQKSLNAPPLQSTRSLQWTHGGLTQVKHSRRGGGGGREPQGNTSRIVARERKRGDSLDLYARTAPLEAPKANISIDANHRREFPVMHVSDSSAYLHVNAQRHGFQQKTGREEMLEKFGPPKKRKYSAKDAAKNFGTRLTRAPQRLETRVRTHSEDFLSRHKTKRTAGMACGHDFVTQEIAVPINVKTQSSFYIPG